MFFFFFICSTKYVPDDGLVSWYIISYIYRRLTRRLESRVRESFLLVSLKLTRVYTRQAAWGCRTVGRQGQPCWWWRRAPEVEEKATMRCAIYKPEFMLQLARNSFSYFRLFFKCQQNYIGTEVLMVIKILKNKLLIWLIKLIFMKKY